MTTAQVGQGNQMIEERLNTLTEILDESVRTISWYSMDSMYHRGVVLIDYADYDKLDKKLKMPVVDAKIAGLTFIPLTDVGGERGEIAKEIVVVYMDEDRTDFGLGIILRDYPFVCLTLSAAEVREHVVPSSLSFDEQLAASYRFAALVDRAELLAHRQH